MSQVLYFDCASGASGDMVLGALLDLGLPLDGLREALGGLLPPGCDVAAERVLRSGISAISFRVIEGPAPGARHHDHDHHHDHHHGHHHHRTLEEIGALIDRSGLSPEVAGRAKALYARLADVEAGIHGLPLSEIHLHEVGALDSVVDVVGAVWGLDRLKADVIVSSPLNVGSGSVDTAHGRLPVPAPATLRLLEGVPIYADGPAVELVTPTGALLVSGHAQRYGAMPPMTVRASGYGAGGRDIPGRPNVLRAVLGDLPQDDIHDRVVVLECNIDDMNPQIFGVVMDRLYAAGALEVFFTPVHMKKGRPGTLVTVLSPPDRRETLAGLLFAETTTIGIRYHDVDRECLAREIIVVDTPLGAVRFKLARRGASIVNASPEFDDCARLAAAQSRSVKDVQAEAMRAYLTRHEER